MIPDSSVLKCLNSTLHQPLKTFKEQQGLGSYFQAIEAILTAYFGITPPSASPGSITELISQVTQLNEGYQDIKRSVALLEGATAFLLLQYRTNTLTTTLKKPLTRKKTARTIQGTLTGTQLAKRLNTSSATISKRRSTDDFSIWSQQQDPDGIAWEYNSSLRRFQPIELTSLFSSF